MRESSRSLAVSVLNRNPPQLLKCLLKSKNVLDTKSSVKFGFINVRSLFCHIDELRIFMNDHNIDIFCVAETWLNDKINNNSVALNGYNILRYDRKHKRGGGVCIYFRKQFNMKVILATTYGITSITEVLMAELILSSITILIAVCYTPKTPTQADLNNFQVFLSSHAMNYSHFITGCDLNLDMLNSSHKFHDLLKAKFLISIPFSPTRGSAWLDQCSCCC